MSDHILLGTQLETPYGYLSLVPGIVYHFLVRKDSVRLVLFEERAPVRIGKKQRIEHPPPEVQIIELDGDYFDKGIDRGDIVVKPFQAPLPVWCGDTSDEGKKSVKGTQNSKKPKITHDERVAKKLAAYRIILENIGAVIKSDDPISEINLFARNSQPQLNEKRVRADIFSYILYGRNKRVIAYKTRRIGKWERLGHPGMKAGVKSLGIGKLYTKKSTDQSIIDDIKKGWKKWGMLGESIESVYQNTCSQIWRAQVITDSRGRKIQVLSDGTSPITYSQFRYQLINIYGQEKIIETLSGRAFVREEVMPSIGKFTESISNAGERTEADGYWIEEVVMGPDGENPLPALVAVRIVCCVTGMYFGIGFSIGGEKAAAYRMALFCAAVKKSIFGRLIGLEIDDASWPSIGLCDDAVTDRGAGGGQKGRANTNEGNPIIHSMPPTGFGQGKAIVESSNPRKKAVRDRPAHSVTSLCLIDVIRREVQKTITLNDARDMSGRVTPKMIEYLDRTTPLDIFNKLSERGRNCLRPIAFDDAVRAFLTPVELTAKIDGVYHRHQRYTAEKLYELGILQAVTSSGNEMKLHGFMLDMSTRYCFLEWDGELIEMAAILALREDEDQLFISLHQLEETDRILRELKSDHRIHSDAAKVEGDQEFSKKTGVPPEKKTIKKGTAKRRNKKGNAQASAVKAVLTHADINE